LLLTQYVVLRPVAFPAEKGLFESYTRQGTVWIQKFELRGDLPNSRTKSLKMQTAWDWTRARHKWV